MPQKHRFKPKCLRLAAFSALCFVGSSGGQTSVDSSVRRALDAWTGRDSVRSEILKITATPVPLLTAIAKSKEEPASRRSRTISLLATFPTAETRTALAHLTDDESPEIRCFALRSLVEVESQNAIRVLINKLDDDAVCMKRISTDPPREDEVYVSDEAVRLLEIVTRKTLGTESRSGHRATLPWKEWWSKQQANRSSYSNEK
jgi:hypothetical protein